MGNPGSCRYNARQSADFMRDMAYSQRFGRRSACCIAALRRSSGLGDAELSPVSLESNAPECGIVPQVPGMLG